MMNADGSEAPPKGGASRFGNRAWKRLQKFSTMLISEGELRGLIGPHELGRLWSRHILNSTAIVDFIPDGSFVVDVGTGAGFPGMVIAIIRPDLNLFLVESMERRSAWLHDVVDAIGLDNVEIYHGRAERLSHVIQADIVTARAVASVRRLLPVTMPLLKSSGSLLTLKGSRVDEEINAAFDVFKKTRAAWADVYDVIPFGTNEMTRVLEVRKK